MLVGLALVIFFIFAVVVVWDFVSSTILCVLLLLSIFGVFLRFRLSFSSVSKVFGLGFGHLISFMTTGWIIRGSLSPVLQFTKNIEAEL